MCLKNEEKFDAILLDAPCSSERHVLADKKYLSEWSFSRIKTLSMAQWALLSSAWRMLKEEGYLLYSTCALSPNENDNVISRLIKKFDNLKILEPKISLNYKKFTEKSLPDYEKTEFGAHILPDTTQGAGPLYFCLLQKSAPEGSTP
jgi:16S rRNA C967 or C1407 C5-methylase (RsmB/RsmF family)